MKPKKLLYITSIRPNSLSGDRIHVDAIAAHKSIKHVNSRYFLLLAKLLINMSRRGVIRESISLILISAFLPNYILKAFLKNKYIEINGSILDEGISLKYNAQNLIKRTQLRILTSAKGVIFVSNGLMQRFQHLYGDRFKSTVIENGTDMSCPEVLETNIKYAYVGANTQWQDIAGLLHKVDLLHTKDPSQPEVHLAGPNLDDIDKREYNNIKIINHGIVDSKTAEKIYYKSSVLLCPDTRIFGKFLLSSPIKMYQGLRSGCVILFMHKWSWQEVLHPFCCNVTLSIDYFDRDKEDGYALLSKMVAETSPRMTSALNTRSWDDVVQELVETVIQ